MKSPWNPGAPSDRNPSTLSHGPAPAAPFNRLQWGIRLVVQPLLFLAAGAALLGLLGLAQRFGWISAGDGTSAAGAGNAAADVDYICPMMCTPPQKEPGRCPVCAMKLVPASAGSGGDGRSIVIDPATRRVANIRTAVVTRGLLSREIRTVGEVQYDEGTLKTIAAYSDGRFDDLYVDFTGAEVRRGERLASFYSPELYSAQFEYLQAARAIQDQSSGVLTAVLNANRRLRENARQRLVELGMSDVQIAELDQTQQAQSRIDIRAPMSGTVIEKLAAEGEYVKAGQPVFRLADLSKVWLMLEVFPEDLSDLRVGMAVDATIKSLPAEVFSGRISFVDTDVNPGTRTGSARVVLDNNDGLLRVGDYARARIQLGLKSGDTTGQSANAAVADSSETEELTVPRSAVLMAAEHSVVYVESEPGRFEIRRIITGNTSGNTVVVIKGLAEGEVVATSGNFLLDSQMQLAGNPSLIDPSRAAPPMELLPGFDAKMLAAIHELPEDDQTAAIEQAICPVTDLQLGSMGTPPKVLVEGKPVFICCEGCRDRLLRNPDELLHKLISSRNSGVTEPDEQDSDVLLPPIGPIEMDLPDGQRPPVTTDDPQGSTTAPPNAQDPTGTSVPPARRVR